MKRATRLLQLLAILLFLPLMAHGQSEDLHAFLWTQAGGMQDLGTITGSQNSIAYGISELGEIVGSDVVGTHATPFRWKANAGMEGLPDFGTIEGYAVAVNSSGEIVGDYYPDGTSAIRAFIWTPTAGLQDLGTLGGSTAAPLGINRPGQVVGYSDTSSGANHGFLWTQSGGMQDLGTFFPCAINDAGLMAGTTYAANGDPEAAVWNNGKVSILGPGGACGINNRGQVVGTRYTPQSSTEQAFIWTPGGAGMQLLPQLPGAVATIGEAINDSGEVVGWNFPPPGGNAYQAFIWTSTGGTQDIGNLGGLYGAQAFAINDSGQVVGSSTIQ
jgi:probable HAF family extracellular repeat protein